MDEQAAIAIIANELLMHYGDAVPSKMEEDAAILRAFKLVKRVSHVYNRLNYQYLTRSVNDEKTLPQFTYLDLE